MEDENRVRIIAAVGSVLAMALLFLLFGNSDGARGFLGEWRGENGDLIQIEEWEGTPLSKVGIGNGLDAELQLPIIVRPFSWGKGGIYRSPNGDNLFILYCEGGQHNVDILIRGSGGSSFEIGIPDRCGSFDQDSSTFEEVMMAVHPDSCHSKSPKKWLTYTRPQ